MKVNVALIVVLLLVPFYLIGLAARLLIMRLWAWAIR
jgi:hypothetical protein